MDLRVFSDKIRLQTYKMIKKRGFGHLGGALSIVETLSVLYGKEMKYDGKNPQWSDRDYFILSKGHGGPSYYSTLALVGYFPMEELSTLNEPNTNLPSHPDRKLIKGVDMTTGSLGQGLSVAVGLAKGLKVQGKDNNVYCVVGDGEMNEGQCWEAFMTSAHHKLNNLYVFIDDNKKQLDGYTKDIVDPISFSDKMNSFGFDTFVVDGHDVDAIDEAIQKGKSSNKPKAIILNTVKCKGIKYFEEMQSNHHIRLDEEGKKALDEAIIELEKKLGE